MLPKNNFCFAVRTPHPILCPFLGGYFVNDFKKRLYEKQADENQKAIERRSFIRSIPWYAWALLLLMLLDNCAHGARFRKIETYLQRKTDFKP